MAERETPARPSNAALKELLGDAEAAAIDRPDDEYATGVADTLRWALGYSDARPEVDPS